MGSGNARRPVALVASEAQVQAESVIARVLAAVVATQVALMIPGIVIGWPTAHCPMVAAAACVCCVVTLAHLGWLGWAPGGPSRVAARLRDRRPDLFLAIGCCVLGVALEAVVVDPGISAGMTSVGYPAMTVAIFVSAARLPLPVAGLLAVVSGVSHPISLRGYPVPGWQGLVLIAAYMCAASWGASEIRRAARDADVSRARAVEAERAMAGAHIHDTQGLLHLATRAQHRSSRLGQAVVAAEQRADEWLNGAEPSTLLAQNIAQLIRRFPDLKIQADVTRLRRRIDSESGSALSIVLHTLLTNIRIHAHAMTVRIVANDTPDGWVIELCDDGRGFDLRRAQLGHGLTTFGNNLAASAGFTMAIHSTPGHGTAITLTGTAKLDAHKPTRWCRRRFASWRSRPAQGLARAAWISDQTRSAVVLVMAWPTTLIALSDVARQTLAPRVAVALIVAGLTILTLSWLRRATPVPATTGLMLVLVATCGLAATFLGGDFGQAGNKLGPFLIVWTCMYAATVHGLMPMSLAFGIGAGAATTVQFGGLAGAFMAAWCICGAGILHLLVLSLNTFGVRADEDKARLTQAERRHAADLLAQQITLLRQLAHDPEHPSTGVADLARVEQLAEAYLAPPQASARLHTCLERDFGALPGEHLQFDFGGLISADVIADSNQVSEAISHYARAFLDSSTAPLSVRGSGTGAVWRVSLLLNSDHESIEPPTRALEDLGLQVRPARHGTTTLREIVQPGRTATHQASFLDASGGD